MAFIQGQAFIWMGLLIEEIWYNITNYPSNVYIEQIKKYLPQTDERVAPHKMLSPLQQQYDSLDGP